MKIVAINGSPRKNGNNARLLEVVRAEVEKAGVEFEVVQPGANVKPCLACYRCLDTGSLRCVQDDAVNA
ncbi:MAG: NAD(P)H-dependent oxidoreductase, partial [Clostridiales bacterium]|nr:NAD(P)H-dependent oxidoreductase [Clostridiales bacterium]